MCQAHQARYSHWLRCRATPRAKVSYSLRTVRAAQPQPERCRHAHRQYPVFHPKQRWMTTAGGLMSDRVSRRTVVTLGAISALGLIAAPVTVALWPSPSSKKKPQSVVLTGHTFGIASV